MSTSSLKNHLVTQKISMDDGDHGCCLTFYEKEPENAYEFEEEFTDDIDVDQGGIYLSISRIYNKDQFKRDYYYIEVSSLDISEEFDRLSADLYKTKLIVHYRKEIIEVSFKAVDSEYDTMKNLLNKIINNSGHFAIHE